MLLFGYTTIRDDSYLIYWPDFKIDCTFNLHRRYATSHLFTLNKHEKTTA